MLAWWCDVNACKLGGDWPQKRYNMRDEQPQCVCHDSCVSLSTARQRCWSSYPESRPEAFTDYDYSVQV